MRLANGVSIGGNEVVVMAGPCSVESREQLFATAEAYRNREPRCCAAELLNRAALLILFKATEKTLETAARGRRTIQAASDQRSNGDLANPDDAPYVDILQVGARNMQNFNLLRELGKVRKPVLLKAASRRRSKVVALGGIHHGRG